MKPDTLYCAVYTRKSTDEGLEQSFNSLHAQREACEAYIASQRHEGWKLVPTAYNDGGISGGTMDRPGLKQLLEDIEAHKVNVVVVYKVDRLTRSLADFARMIETFDTHDVSFVSVTQQFNTTSSMGRLTLNVLLSFAQFEREVTGERIRDKFAASKKKGIWMGGPVPFGYDLGDRELRVNKREAEIVRSLFQLYADVGSVPKVAIEASRRGYVTRVRIMTSGRRTGGTPFCRSHLYHFFRNPIYIGRIGHKGSVYDGRHAAIISDNLWDTVQTKLNQNRRVVANGLHAKTPSLLIGRIFDDRGNLMSPHASAPKVSGGREGRRHRYYVSQAVLQNRKGDAGSLPRLPAHNVEQIVLDEICKLLASPDRLLELFDSDDGRSPEQTGRALSRCASLAANWGKMPSADRANLVRVVLMRVTVGRESAKIAVSCSALRTVIDGSEDKLALPSSRYVKYVPGDAMLVSVKTQLRRFWGGSKLVVQGPNADKSKEPDSVLVKALARAHTWNKKLIDRTVPSINAIAREEELSSGYVRRLLPLAFLAPDIVTAILDGRQPRGLSLQHLTGGLPLIWSDQCQQIGLDA